MRCIFFLQTSNLHPNKQKYKNEKKKHFIFIIQNNNKNRKHILKKKVSKKKLKHEPSLKKTGGFHSAQRS